MLVAIILAVVAAIVIPVELVRRPFRSAWAWACKWVRLIRQLPRLEQAVENIAWMIANDEADYGSTEQEHQEAIQGLHDFLTGQRDSAGVRRRPRSMFG
jgi:type IV secretory pathway VirB2 component (pilin)